MSLKAFVYGVGDIIELSPNPKRYKSKPFFESDDTKAIQKDWEIVGDDIKGSIKAATENGNQKS